MKVLYINKHDRSRGSTTQCIKRADALNNTLVTPTRILLFLKIKIDIKSGEMWLFSYERALLCGQLKSFNK